LRSHIICTAYNFFLINHSIATVFIQKHSHLSNITTISGLILAKHNCASWMIIYVYVVRYVQTG